MEEFIGFVARYDPDYPSSIDGSDEAEIERLEAARGHRLPAAARQFLASCGRSTGTFHPFAAGTDARIESITRFYQRGPAPFPERFTLLAIDNSINHLDVFLEELTDAPEPRVVQFTRNVPFDPNYHFFLLADSLPDQLFGNAFYELRLTRLPVQYSLVAAAGTETLRPRFAELPQLAELLGLARVPHTSRWAPCFDRADAAIFAYQPPPFAPIIHLGGETEKSLLRIAEVLVDQMGFTFAPK